MKGIQHQDTKKQIRKTIVDLQNTSQKTTKTKLSIVQNISQKTKD